jgi:hypothetical protein
MVATETWSWIIPMFEILLLAQKITLLLSTVEWRNRDSFCLTVASILIGATYLPLLSIVARQSGLRVKLKN